MRCHTKTGVTALSIPLLLALFGLSVSGCGRVGYDALATADASLDDADARADGGSDRASFGGLCAFDAHVIIENGVAADDAVGAALSQTLLDACPGSPSRRVTDQSDASAVDPDTGRPLVPADELVVLGGGDGPHRVVRYLLGSDTPLVWSGVDPATITERATGRTVVMGPTSSDHDYVFVQVVEEPVGGTVAVSAQGFRVNGTRAAALYFDQVFSSRLSSDPGTWFVVEWTDGDGDPMPSAGDDFALLETG